MKLIDFKLKDERVIKSIVFENEKNLPDVTYSDFEEYKNKYNKYVTIYKPNKENVKEIINILSKTAKIEDKTLKNEEDPMDTYKIFKMLTDIDFGDNVDEELLIEIINNPPLLWLKANEEINSICNHIFLKFYNSVEELSKYPEVVRDAMITASVNRELEKQNKEEELELERKRRELEKELEALNSKKKKKATKVKKNG